MHTFSMNIHSFDMKSTSINNLWLSSYCMFNLKLQFKTAIISMIYVNLHKKLDLLFCLLSNASV